MSLDSQSTLEETAISRNRFVVVFEVDASQADFQIAEIEYWPADRRRSSTEHLMNGPRSVFTSISKRTCFKVSDKNRIRLSATAQPFKLVLSVIAAELMQRSGISDTNGRLAAINSQKNVLEVFTNHTLPKWYKGLGIDPTFATYCTKNNRKHVYFQFGPRSETETAFLKYSKDDCGTEVALSTHELEQILTRNAPNLKLSEMLSNTDCLQTVGERFVVRLEEVGPILAACRKIAGPNDIVLKDRVLIALTRNSLTHQEKLLLATVRDNLATFERGSESGEYDLRDLKSLMECYDNDTHDNDMPELMIEWLGSRSSTATCVKCACSEFKDPRAMGSQSERKAVGSTYLIPPVRPDGFGCALAVCKFDPNTDEATLNRVSAIDTSLAQKTPHTIPHQHMGDEVIICLEGEVVVELANNGTRTVLAQYDLIHFNAEIPHTVWNVREFHAQILVIRFFQLRRQSTREMQLSNIHSLRQCVDGLESTQIVVGNTPDELNAITAALFAGKAANLMATQVAEMLSELYLKWNSIESWIRDRERSPHDRLRRIDGENDKAIDFVGLSAFLTKMIRTDPKSSRNGLGEADYVLLKQLLTEFDDETSTFAIATEEEAKALATDRLGKLKRLNMLRVDLSYAICRGRRSDSRSVAGRKDEATLVDEIYSALTGDISGLPSSVRGRVLANDVFATCESLNLIAEYFEIPAVLLYGSLSPPILRCIVVRNNDEWVDTQALTTSEAKYFIPCRVLANSDVSIVRLELPRGSRTAKNWHTGWELVMPLSGEVEVQFPDSDANDSQRAQKHECLVYRSIVPHIVSNVGKSDAVALVIRFNEVEPK